MNRPILEVIACTLADAVAAERGGANRLEIISHFEVGGLTPQIDLVRKIISTVKIPVRVMIREVETFFIKDEKIIESLCESARSLSDLCVDGMVLGFLKEESGQAGIDHDLLARVLSCAPNINATFHRAFELLPDPLRAIVELKGHRQIDKILTSGGGAPWLDKVEGFEIWEKAARPEIAILAGGGIDFEAVKLIRRKTNIREFHVGSAAREGDRVDGAIQADRVRELVELVESDGDNREAC